MIIEEHKGKEVNPQSESTSTAEPRNSLDVPDDLPPDYTPRPSQEDSYTLPSIPPSNFLSLKRAQAAVDGTWVIDPALTIPSFLLPPLKEGETRRNLVLESNYGSVNADVWLVPQPSSSSAPRSRVTMEFIASCDYMRVTLHRNDDYPMHVECNASGNITILLPRNFRGIVSSRCFDGAPHCSNDLFARTMTLSEVHGERRAFVGPLPTSEEGDAWPGDELVLRAHMGGIKLLYEDEKRPRFVGSRPASMIVTGSEAMDDVPQRQSTPPDSMPSSAPPRGHPRRVHHVHRGHHSPHEPHTHHVHYGRRSSFESQRFGSRYQVPPTPPQPPLSPFPSRVPFMHPWGPAFNPDFPIPPFNPRFPWAQATQASEPNNSSLNHD